MVQRLLLVLLFPLLAACQGIDRKPDTVLEGLYVASVQAEGLVLSSNRAFSAGQLTEAQHMYVLNNMERASRVLQDSLNACKVGVCLEAPDRLTQVENTLRTVALLLSQYTERQ